MVRRITVIAFILLAVSGLAVEPRVWNDSFYATKDSADLSGVPMLLLWENFGCHNCEEMEKAIETAEFTEWMRKGPEMVFCRVVGVGTAEDEAAKAFAKYANGLNPTGISTYPFVCIYVPTKGGAEFSAVNFTGVDNRMPVTSGTLAGQLIASVEQALGFSGGSFAAFPMGDTDNDRLEAVVGTTRRVEIPVVRTNQMMRMARTTVKVTFNGATLTANQVWSAGETEKFVSYPIPEGFTVGSKAEVSLTETEEGTLLATRHIWGVGEVENSPKNPLWLGERTKDTLGWGEWTMDLDAVTNRVADYKAAHPGERAYSMVLIGGSCWCPDCAMADGWFFDTEDFRTWAREKKVALGVVDIPNVPTTPDAYPSLLTYTSSRASDGYITLRNTRPADESMRYQSGAGYLSRHSVSRVDAVKVIERNRALCGQNTLEGGWNRPERANKSRPGVPILLVLRDDGSIAGRWNPFSSIGPSAFSSGYLRRFEELFDQLDDSWEEANDHWSTTTDAVDLSGNVPATVSAADVQDVYRVDAPKNTLMTFTLSGSVDTPFILRVTDDSGAASETLAEAQGSLAAGITISDVLLTSDNCHLCVSYPVGKNGYAETGFFAITSSDSTVCSYTVQSSGVMSGGEIGFVRPVIEAFEGAAGETTKVEVAVHRVNGCRGAASATVRLKSVDGDAGGVRYIWSDQTLRWADADREHAEQKAVLWVVGNAEAERDLTFEFELAGLSADAMDTRLQDGATALTLHVYDDDVFGTLLYKGVSARKEHTMQGYVAGDVLTVQKRSGSMPAGVSARVEGGKVVAGGVPCIAGEYSATYRVSIVRNGVTVASEQVVFDFTVREVDFAAKLPALRTARTYRNLPVVDPQACSGSSDDDKRTYVAGLLTLTVPSSGKLSARYVTDGKAYSFSASAWSAFHEGDPVSLTAELVRTDDRTETMIVKIVENGGFAVFRNPFSGSELAVELPERIWGADHTADKWSGQYVAHLVQTNSACGSSLPRITADGYLAMRMITETAARNGAMLYAGLLPNGQPFSGSSVLVEIGSEVRMPVFHFSRASGLAYVFAGAFGVKPNAALEYKTSRWSVYTPEDTMVRWQPSETPAVTDSADLLAYGGFYDSTELYDCFQEDYKGRTEDFAFRVDSTAVDSARYGQAQSIAPVRAQVTEADNAPSLVPGADNPKDVTLKFSPVTGIVSGSFLLPFDEGDLAVTYRGLVLPGWVGCGGGCSDIPVSRPFASGMSSFADRDGKAAFRNGCGVKLDAGE